MVNWLFGLQGMGVHCNTDQQHGWTFYNFLFFQLQVTLEELFLAGGVTVSLVSSLIIVSLSKFHMSRGYGIYLIILYVAFLAIALLIETNVIKNTNH